MVWASTRSGRPRLAQIRAASASAAYPPRPANWSSSGAVPADQLLVGVLGQLGLELVHLGQQRVQAAGGEHPVAGGDLQVAGARVLRQVADGAAPVDCAGVRLPSPASTFSVVVLPAPLRPTRPIRSPGCTRRVVSDSRMREPARSSRPVAVIMAVLALGVGRLTQGTRKRRRVRSSRSARGSSAFAAQHDTSVPNGAADYRSRSLGTGETETTGGLARPQVAGL